VGAVNRDNPALETVTMRKLPMKYLSILSAALVLAGCAGTSYTPIRYFMVEVPHQAAEPIGEGPSLGYRPLIAAKPYKSVAMAYRPANNELAYRLNEEWAEYPSDTMTRALSDALQATGQFADVGDAARMPLPDFILTGAIRAYHEDRTASPPVAVLEIHLELRERRGEMALWDHVLHAREPMDGISPAALASAMTKAVAHVADEAAAGIANAARQVRDTP
jgi:ABC-type uncharacterized transport system auxiliary subunit